MAVLDTNVLVSAAIGSSRHGAPAAILMMAAQGVFEIVTSPVLLNELQRSLLYARVLPRLRSGAPSASEFIRRLAREARIVYPEVSVAIVETDPDDDRVIEAAIAGGADFIVTNDSDLLALKSYEGIRILRPQEFLAHLRSVPQ